MSKKTEISHRKFTYFKLFSRAQFCFNIRFVWIIVTIMVELGLKTVWWTFWKIRRPLTRGVRPLKFLIFNFKSLTRIYFFNLVYLKFLSIFTIQKSHMSICFTLPPKFPLFNFAIKLYKIIIFWISFYILKKYLILRR